MSIQPHQQRVIDEKLELDGRLVKLVSFGDSVVFSTLPEAERARLQFQAQAMQLYSSVLGDRIKAFNLAE